MLNDCWTKRLGCCVVIFCRWGYEELGLVAYGDCGVAVGHKVQNGVLHYGVWEGVASDISPAVVPMKELYVGDEDAMSAPSGEYLVCVWHIDEIYPSCYPHRRRRIRCRS